MWTEAMDLIDITRDLMHTPVYPGDPEPKLTPFQSLAAGDGCNMAVLTSALHAGTHADSPLHFFRSGADISRLSAERFIGPCTVIEVPPGPITGAYVNEHFPRVERLLLKGGGRAYFERTGAEEAAFLGIRLIGTDANSVGCPQDQKDTVKALGLRKLQSEVVREDNAPIRGMIFKVKHLVQVEEV